MKPFVKVVSVYLTQLSLAEEKESGDRTSQPHEEVEEKLTLFVNFGSMTC